MRYEGNGVNFQSARGDTFLHEEASDYRASSCTTVEVKVGMAFNDKTKRTYFVVSASYT